MIIVPPPKEAPTVRVEAEVFARWDGREYPIGTLVIDVPLEVPPA